jgi:hypothetical protein
MHLVVRQTFLLCLAECLPNHHRLEQMNQLNYHPFTPIIPCDGMAIRIRILYGKSQTKLRSIIKWQSDL